MELLIVSRAIYPLHGIGGMEKHCHDWIHALSKHARIHAVTMPPDQIEFFGTFPDSVSFYFVPGTKSTRVLPRITSYPKWTSRVHKFLKAFLRDKTIDAIYAHGLAAYGCIDLGAPLFYNPHGMEEFKSKGIKYSAYTSFRSMSRKAATKANAVIATDEIMVPEVQQFLKIPPEKIAVLPNSIFTDEPEAGTQGIDKFRNLNGCDPVFMAAGRHEPNKGFLVLIEALRRVKNLPPQWKLIITGSGSETGSLVSRVKQLGLQNHVLFTGFVHSTELNALYRRSQIFIQPALYEGSSIVTLEAMRHGLPVIASRTGGIPDKIRDDWNGWLVEPGDPEQLANTIEKALATRQRWADMGAKSRQVVKDRFSWNITAQKFLETFRNPKYLNH